MLTDFGFMNDRCSVSTDGLPRGQNFKSKYRTNRPPRVISNLTQKQTKNLIIGSVSWHSK